MGMGYGFQLVGGTDLASATGVVFTGVQMRNERPGHVWPIEARNCKDNLIVIRLPSGKCWSGTGRPFRYVPPEVVVIRLDFDGKEAMPVLHVDIGRKKSSETI